MAPDNYSLIVDERFDNLDGWMIGQVWGKIHPDNTHQYYSKHAVKIGDGLRLLVDYRPEVFTMVDAHGHTVGFGQDEIGTERYNAQMTDPRKKITTIVSDYAVGLVSSRDVYKYGYFEVEVLLPKSRGVWPAVWLSADDWPPEIDILEGYGKYNDSFGWWFIDGIFLQSNVFYRDGDEKNMLGGRNHPVWYDTTKKSITVSCLWTPEVIEIYYNGVVVRTIDDPIILKSFNECTGMRLILNNAVMEKKRHSVVPNHMTVKSVKIYETNRR